MRTSLAAGFAGFFATIGLVGVGRFAPLPHDGPLAAAPVHVPFRVGEKLTYQAKLNFINAGTASMTVAGLEPIRGHTTYHTVFDVNGHMLFFHVHDHYESWFDTTSLVSLHHTQHIDEASYQADRTYDFFPDKRTYVRNGQENPGVAEPLDEGSFIYFVRSIPLQVGQTYQFDRYYHPDRNPVIITVERRERITVPAGTFDAVVVHPVIKSKGLFSENGDAEIWFADDSTRALLRLKSKLSFGTLYLELKNADYGPPRR